MFRPGRLGARRRRRDVRGRVLPRAWRAAERAVVVCLRLRATHPGLDGLAVALGEMVDRGLQPARATASMRVPRTDISARVTLSIRRADFVAITYSSPWPWIGRPTSFSKLSSPCAVSRKSIPSSAH
jgi:hypothetical protein